MGKIYLRDEEKLKKYEDAGYPIHYGPYGSTYVLAEEAPTQKKPQEEDGKNETQAKEDENPLERKYSQQIQEILGIDGDIDAVNAYDQFRRQIGEMVGENDKEMWQKLITNLRTELYSKYKQSPNEIKLKEVRQKLDIGD